MPDASSFALRPAAVSDLAALTAIDARCFPPGIAYPKEEITYLLETPASLTLVIEHSQAIIGFASVRELHRRRFPHQARRGELITIDVLPEYRRVRAGLQLHQGLEAWLRSGGIASIELHVAVENLAAIGFYERLGYHAIGHVPNYYLETLDAWRMEKII